MEVNDSELLHIYDNIVLKNLSYCSICFRVDNESRLVHPKAIKDLIEVFKLPGEFITQIRVICYVCEAHATRALRFYSVVSTAGRMHGLFHKMFKRKRFDIQVRECLKTRQRPKIFKSELHKNAWECEEQMKKVRSQFRLQQTEILNIDTEMYQVNSSEEDNPLVMTMQNITPECSPVMETLVILDDEDESKVNIDKTDPTPKVKCDKTSMKTPKLVPIEKLLEPPRPKQNFMSTFTPIPVLQPETVVPSYMLHPIVMESDGSVKVPSLGANLIYQNNTNPLLVMNASDPTIFVGNQNNSTVLLGNKKQSTILVVNKDNSSVLVGKQDVTSSLEKKKQSTTILYKTLTAQDELPSVMIKEGSVTSSSVEHDLETILRKAVDACQNHNKRSCNGSSSVSKRAKESVNEEREKDKESRIDWEDRIPMDVISFVDAVDPHADPQLLDPDANKPRPSASTGQVNPLDPMGVISEVRSVMTPTSTQTNHRMDDFIDLC